MEARQEVYMVVHSRYWRVNQEGGLNNVRKAEELECNDVLPWMVFNNGGI